jgi:hypothetical protein
VHGNTNKPAPGTKAGFGLRSAVNMWPTPCAQNHRIGMANRYGPGERRSMLNDAVAARMWPTPTATAEHQGLCTPTKGREGGTLVEAVSARMRPTPTSRDWKSSSMGHQGNARPLSEHLPGPLNPAWVELLMGLPPGWTELQPGSEASPE